MGTSDGIKASKLFTEYLKEISSDEESAAFLNEEGVDTKQLLSKALKKIKIVQMNMSAEATERKFQAMKTNSAQRAKDQVRRLLADSTFNLESFIKREKLQVAYRNFENMTQSEIIEFLERHYMLKIEKEGDNS